MAETKITRAQKDDIRKRVEDGSATQTQLAIEYGVSRQLINQIVHKTEYGYPGFAPILGLRFLTAQHEWLKSTAQKHNTDMAVVARAAIEYVMACPDFDSTLPSA